MGVSKKSVSWTSTFVTKVLQEHGRRSDVIFLVQTFWTPPNVWKEEQEREFWKEEQERKFWKEEQERKFWKEEQERKFWKEEQERKF